MFGSTPFGSSTFGSNTSAFGSTAGATFGSTGFGTGSSIFGAKTTATTAFGTATPAQTGTSLFGSTATGPTGLFGGANAQKKSGFGGFGTTGTTGGLFGSSGSSGTSLFSGSMNAFGNANKSIFGTSTNTTGSIFGTTTTTTGTSLFGAKPQTTGSVFGSTTTGGLFGNTATAGQNVAGTPAKFIPQTSTDTMMKNGISASISTKHQCITLMKEYDKKSLEELRMEDYTLGRKGPQASGTGTSSGTGLFANTFGTSTGGSTFGTGGFGASTGTSVFGQTGQTNMFGAKTTSGGLFGNSSTTFTAPSAFTNTSGSLFGNSKPGGLFGTTTTTQSTGLFGTTPAFGAASSGSSLFGTPSFGQTPQAGIFGASSQASGLFGKPAFGASTSGSSLFGTSTFGQTSQPSLFGAKSTTGTFGTANTGLFGTQNKPAFGTNFGTGTSTNPFGTSTGTGLFGTSTLGFGTTGSTLGQTSTLGGALVQPALGTGTGLLGQNNVAALQQQQQLQQQLQQQVLALTSSPFGDSPLYRNLTSRTRSERPSALSSQVKQRGASIPSQYKVSPRPSARVKPRAIGKPNFSQTRLFDGLDDEIEYSGETFVPRRSIKKLVINSKSQTRSIASELSNSSLNNENDHGNSPETSRIRPASSSEKSRESFYSPKSYTSLDKDDQYSPVVGVRRSNIPREEQVNGEASTAQVEPLNALGNEDKDSDDEQGPEPGLGETLEDQALENAKRGGCGIILKRPEYYCNPSIAELDDMVNENGDVIVGDFVVGREGFGMVKFFGEFNVAGLNLDEIVSFRRREIEVYPDAYPNKPPVGEGLNRKSEVTLYKVWPNDKTTRTPIKKPDRLQKVGWLEKLENATARLGATFVDYQAETGTWIFTVDHFTRYGLKEVQIEMEDGTVMKPPLRSFDEQDKEKLLEEVREKNKAAIAMKMRMEEDFEKKKKMLQEKMYDENSSVLEAQDDSQMTDISQETFPEFQEPLEEEDNTASPASHHLATAMGVKSHRMQVMKASFFGEDNGAQQYINNNDMRPREFRLGNKSVLSSTGFDEFDGKSIHERPIYSPVKTKSVTIYPEPQDKTRTVKERRTEYKNYRNKSQWYSLPQPILLPSTVGSPSEAALKAAGIRTQPALVPLPQSVTAGKHHLLADAGLTMGRSFRVGWGPAWTLVYSSRAMSVSPNSINDERLGRETIRGSPLASSVNKRQSSSFTISCARVNVSPTMKWNSDVSQAQLIERLEICLANVRRNEDDSSVYFQPTEGVTALHQYAEIGAKAKEMLASSTFKDSASTFSSVMDLAVALWGNLSMLSNDLMDTENEDVAMGDYDEALARKEALSNWLSKTSHSVVNEEIENIKTKDNNHLRIIFSLLTGKQINAACQVAQSNGDSRLSLLLAQSSGNMIVRQWLLKQLDDWLEHKVDKFVTADRLKIYALLAGELAWRGIEVCEDLDWKRAFALHLWYQRSSSGLVSDAMTSYENSFKGRTSTGICAAEPSPSYLANMQEILPERDPEETEHKAIRDTCYHLIKLFCKRSHRLEYTLAPASYTRYQLDASLSWHLYQVLRSAGYNHLSEYYSSYLNASYAAQLEATGLWHWAVFVLMHIQDPLRREQAIQKVLVRYCILDEDAEYNEKETFLLNHLGVPVVWIHEAKVIRSRTENRPKDEAYHLLKSGHFNLSHEVILNGLASSAIINEEYDSIKELLVELAPRENSSQVNHWNTGGQIYLDYIKLWEKFNDIKNGLLVPTVYQLEKMQTKVSSLCYRISELPSKTAMDRLCQSDMGTMCANFLKIIAKELAIQSDEMDTSYHTQSSVLAPHIEKLPLPEDCCLTELRELTSKYVDELAQL